MVKPPMARRFLMLFLSLTFIIFLSSCSFGNEPIAVYTVDPCADERFLNASYAIDSSADVFSGTFDGETLVTVAGDAGGESLDRSASKLFRLAQDAGSVAPHEILLPLKICFKGEIPDKVEYETGWRFNDDGWAVYDCSRIVASNTVRPDRDGCVTLVRAHSGDVISLSSNAFEHLYSGIRMKVYYGDRTVEYLIAYDDTGDRIRAMQGNLKGAS